MSVDYVNNTALVKNEISNRKGIVLRLIGEDVHRRSNPITPLAETKMLRTAVVKNVVGNSKAFIEWRAPYAEYQERGYTTGPVTHYTTPGTHAHFAEESVKAVMDNLITYARQGGLA